MSESTHRLGDLIDDYCPRCRLLLNHAVASLVDSKVAKVICQTCYTEHPYRHGEGGKKKKPAGRAALFGQVLSKAQPAIPDGDPAPAATTPAQGPSQKKKKPAILPRYISRHKTKPPRRGP